MIESIKRLIIRYKEIIMYGIFGAGATLINIVAFYLLHTVAGMALVPANIIAWVLAFIFAFVTNKLWVFESKSWAGEIVLKEFLGFFAARLFTLVLDTALMWLLVEKLHWNDLLSKVIVNVIVIVVNYVASKLWIFKDKH